MESDAMPTAIASCLTLSGFVMAADGNVTNLGREILYTNAQKIFQIPGRPIAYGLYGFIHLDNADEQENSVPILDLSETVSIAARRLSSENCADAMTVGEQIAAPVHIALSEAKDRGLKSYPGFSENLAVSTILHVLLWGYFDGSPAEIDITFWHRDERLGKPSISFMKNNNSKARIVGSYGVWKSLTDPNEPKFSKFRTPNLVVPVERLSLSAAAELVENYIKACDSEEGRSVDSFMCPLIGGHIHTAKITPNGFEWIKSPKLVSS
jgi:hypothetical protein